MQDAYPTFGARRLDGLTSLRALFGPGRLILRSAFAKEECSDRHPAKPRAVHDWEGEFIS